MKKPKPRRKPTQNTVSVASTTLSVERRIDLLLRLWEDSEKSLSDIANALHLSMRAFLKFLKQPDIAEMLEQISALLELRSWQVAHAAAPRALATLEKIQTEAETAARQTPISPNAIKAHREAKADRAQRRLAASTVLSHLRTLSKPVSKVPPLSDQHRTNAKPANPGRNDAARRSVPSQARQTAA
ncbi:MAG: hypothetical protein ACNA8P_06595 [Phycisphaerales bacterium]